MRNLNRVAWMKGMYLAPQHLQQTDRCTAAMLAFLMRTSPVPQWGFLELHVDEEALTYGTFKIVSAQGIFPEGIMFSAPDSDLLPPPLALAEYFSPVDESLEIQLSLSSRTDGEGRLLSSSRYLAHEVEVADELAGADRVQVLLTMANLRVHPAGKQKPAIPG